ncbi:uncharacterized protein LOC133711814 [Rosa rugosa]|uniref:uncharacterized protein LOC133711814 n=1 Tax=Rosa rugosa TaxID=74645 RepID=UPI002B40205D|nr:uncharacterized protein LOC133711814 [Rosa rugosa]
MAFRTLLFLFFAILLVTTMLSLLVSAEELEDEKAKKPKAPTPDDVQTPPLPMQEVYGDEKFFKNWRGVRPCVRRVPGKAYLAVMGYYCDDSSHSTNPEAKQIRQVHTDK